MRSLQIQILHQSHSTLTFTWHTLNKQRTHTLDSDGQVCKCNHNSINLCVTRKKVSGSDSLKTTARASSLKDKVCLLVVTISNSAPLYLYIRRGKTACVGGGGGGWSLSQLTSDQRQASPWTSHQFVTGWHKDKHSLTHNYRQLRVTNKPACLWLAWGRSTQTEPKADTRRTRKHAENHVIYVISDKMYAEQYPMTPEWNQASSSKDWECVTTTTLLL